MYFSNGSVIAHYIVVLKAEYVSGKQDTIIDYIDHVPTYDNITLSGTSYEVNNTEMNETLVSQSKIVYV